MDGIFHELSRRTDPAKLLGYLNFSDGRPDPRFQKGFADAGARLFEGGDAAPWRTLAAWLAHELAALVAGGSAAFRDPAQARAALDAALVRLPAAYRAHHADQLAHQPDAALFGPFFLARCCEAVLRQGGPWDEPDRVVAGALTALNDYVGYRPIAILETRPNTEYYPHEKVRPVPLALAGAGVAPGAYADIVRPALKLLEETDPVLLEEASFDPKRLDELAFDPRAHDHFHPVNKRPNVLFGEWDPHTIDGAGYFRRFVLRQMTLDTLLTWVTPGVPQVSSADKGERLFEAAAVLAGTILMGAGVSGAGPNFHDSAVTLSKLVPRIARYRDAFYQRLLKQLPGAHGERLRAEAERRKQPFAGVRQFLNQAISTQRAAHLQDRRLAQFYAAMGYPAAAREQARKIDAPAVRFGTEIRVRQTEAGFAADRNRPADAAPLLAEVEDLLKRGIGCGALIDPWNVLGYQGLFPIFPGREDTVRDPRAEELINIAGRQLDLYARASAAAALADDGAARERLVARTRAFAAWWDRFATATVSDLPRIVGGERADAAEHVASALAEWSRRKPSSNDVGFWRQHRDGFTSPAAFAQVLEPLLERREWRAALGLLMTWLSESDTVPLDEPGASFEALAERWVRGVLAAAPAADRGPLLKRFFELLDANAREDWGAPHEWLEPRPERGGDDEDEDDPVGSAYEGMVYKDSTDDGVDGSVAGDPPEPAGEFSLEAQADAIEARLGFLHAVAKLWRRAARPDVWPPADPALGAWLAAARRANDSLALFLDRLTEVAVPDPSGGHEGMIEFDRRRAIKGHLLDLGVAACVDVRRAALALSAARPTGPELASGAHPPAGAPEPPPAWEGLLVRIERAIGRGDAAGVRALLPGFAAHFRREPLLYCPPSDGGRPREVLAAQTALSVLEDLVTRLPRLGLLRETFQLTKVARQMEWNNPPEGRRVSSFDQLFRTALTGVVETLLATAATWDADATGEEGPLADALFKIATEFQNLWHQHSQSLRLSVLETVADDDDWEPVKGFVTKYGSDLFTVPFLGLSNMRGILARGVPAWLDHETESGDGGARRPKLVADWDAGALDKARTARSAEVVLQALIEHYDEYRDYNTTTTQSDYGENIHILLDMLRLKVRYDRFAWRMKPLALAHEALCQRGYEALAGRWRTFIAEKTVELADELLKELNEREARYGVKLRTVRDRLEERFTRPLEIDRAAAQVAAAAEAARGGQVEGNPAFVGLRTAIEPLEAIVSGVGLDVPVWVRRLEDALRQTRDRTAEPPPGPSQELTFEELEKQMDEWDKGLGE
ncbi:hypothetical protein R5W24_003101 [Gemmata sp. JC717]|uniref:hypothetical protein n=1 Tax=Gemmata algarum TaxID=2975278 RepID=UPI0021BAB1A6|nr:hypothetical protein [Gemmata algarum]MDY3553987.1 hypothetical protein [Gemmata algarum]